jgi:hypothetical protein
MQGPVTDDTTTTKKVKKEIVIPPKKPKLSKAERRALQEAQRAAKGLKADGSSAGDSGGHGNEAGSKKNPRQSRELPVAVAVRPSLIWVVTVIEEV